MNGQTTRAFRLVADPVQLKAAVRRAAGRHNQLYAARLEHLLASYTPDDRNIRFYLLEDRKHRTGVLGFYGNSGILLTERGFAPADLAALLDYTVGAGDFIACARKDGLRLPLFLRRKNWHFSSGDSFRLPDALCVRKPCRMDVQLRAARPSYDDIGLYWSLFRSGFAGFAGKKRDAFYLEQNHLLRHQTAELWGLYDRNGALLCGCEVAEGSERLRYLFDLTTDRNFRRKGLAAALVRGVAAQDRRPLWLSAQDASLSRYYADLGMVKSGRWMQLRRR